MPDQQPQQATQAAKVLSTEEIQQLLEQNHMYIKAIQENMNLGRLEDATKIQALLHKNLMELAALADIQQINASTVPNS